MRYLLLLVIGFISLKSYSSDLIQLKVKQSVYRGEEPVLVRDLFKVKSDTDVDKGKLANLLNSPVDVTKQAQWINAQDILPQIKDAIVRANGKVWLETCLLSDISSFKNEVINALSEIIATKAIDLKTVKSSTKDGICLPRGKTVTGHNIKVKSQINQSITSFIELNDSSQLPLKWHVEFNVKGLVAKQNLSANKEVIRSQYHIDWVTVDKLDLTDQLFLDSSELVAVKTIKAGTLINGNNAKLLPAIYKGQKVKVLLKKLNIAIETSGKALNEGYQGQTISVLVDNAKQPIRAQVEGKGVVYVSG